MIRKRLIPLIILTAVLIMSMAVFAGCNNGRREPAREEKTLMVGDSLFDLWKPTCAKDLKGIKNLKNVAVGGTTSVFWQKQKKLIERENPTTILMCLGTNDIADMARDGEAVVKGGDGRNECLQSVLEMFKEIVPDVRIYCLTVNICGENVRWNKKDEIIICNQFLREYCEDKDWVEVIETEHAFYDQLEDFSLKPAARYFTPDYLHFSAEGYKVLTKIIRGALGLDGQQHSVPQPAEHKMEKVAFIGDSLFDFWDNIYRDFPDVKGLYDIAIGGTTAEYWTSKWQRTVRLNPKTVVICIGTNDVALGKNGAQAAAGIQAMVELYLDKLPETKFYLCTVYVSGESVRWEKREDILECNRLNREYFASSDRVEIIETQYAWYDDDDYTRKPPKKYFWDDYLHFNDLGYEIYARVIRGALGLDK